MKKLTITIGIPAHNEEVSCVSLINALLKQNKSNFSLLKIIVYSDGSSDKTVERLKRIRSKKLQIVDSQKRRGVSFAQNEIINKTRGDILVLLNADVLIKDENFLKKLIAPILAGKADMTSGNLCEIQPLKYLERIIFISMQWKHRVFALYNGGDNLYTCHGPCRAFSKKIYSRLYFPVSVPEDAYSYLFVKARKFRYAFVKSAVVMYKLPHTLKDYENQSKRFNGSSNQLYKHFDKKFVDNVYKLPIILTARCLAGTFLRFPAESISYVLLLFYIKLKSFSYVNTDLWDISVSSKSIAL